MSHNLFDEFIVLTTSREEMLDITGEVRAFVRSTGIKDGICKVYVPHTTAAVTINENADPDVKSDILKGLEAIVPSDLAYQHAEGNSPAHIKTSIMGSSEEIIISGEDLVLGTWQGIYFCEFDGPRTRKFFVKILEG